MKDSLRMAFVDLFSSFKLNDLICRFDIHACIICLICSISIFEKYTVKVGLILVYCCNHTILNYNSSWDQPFIP